MNDPQSRETGFARRLRAELKSVVAERGAEQSARTAAGELTAEPAWRRRGMRAGLAGAAVVVIAALVVVIGAGGGGTPAAFAVEAKAEGMISVEVRSFEDPVGLDTALEGVGVSASVSYLESGMTCKEPRFQATEDGQGLVAGPVALPGAPSGEGPLTFTIDRDEVGPGQTLVITAWPRPGVLLGNAEMEVAEGAVAPCMPVPASAGDGGGGE